MRRSAWVVNNGDGPAAAAGAEFVADLDMDVAFDPARWREAGAVSFTDADPVHRLTCGGQHG